MARRPTWDEVMERVVRREFLCKHLPLCPECSTPQVQLITYMEEIPARWKCRHCKHKFYFEPEKADGN
jgi:ribosomal protein L37AE/L43A